MRVQMPGYEESALRLREAEKHLAELDAQIGLFRPAGLVGEIIVEPVVMDIAQRRVDAAYAVAAARARFNEVAEEFRRRVQIGLAGWPYSRGCV